MNIKYKKGIEKSKNRWLMDLIKSEMNTTGVSEEDAGDRVK